MVQSLYGTRDAAKNWEIELSGFLCDQVGFRRGKASASIYSEPNSKSSAAVHGDDVIVKTSRRRAEQLIKLFEKRYEIKWQMMGSESDLSKEATILNRTLRWTPPGIW